jgi:flagellin
MSVVINTNVAANLAANNLAASNMNLQKSLNRLSSGSKIVTPADDAGGLAVSIKLSAAARRQGAVNTNIGNAMSVSQTQDGFLKKVTKALDRMSELSILAQDVTKSNADRTLYDSEFQQLADYVDNVATKDFNGVSLFTSTSQSVTIDSDGNTFTMSGVNLSASVYTTATATSVSTSAAASNALASVKSAITQLAGDRAQVGANMSRLSMTSEQLGVLKDNLSAANSRIKDVDVADESTQFARYNILVQAGTAMLAQANSTPQSALRLIG